MPDVHPRLAQPRLVRAKESGSIAFLYRDLMMIRTLLVLAMLGVAGCRSTKDQILQRSEPPDSYLEALAKERGVTKEDARQILLNARQSTAPISKADALAGRLPNRGASEPINPHPASQLPR